MRLPQPPGYPKRNKLEPLPYWVDVQAEVRHCWSQGLISGFVTGSNFIQFQQCRSGQLSLRALPSFSRLQQWTRPNRKIEKSISETRKREKGPQLYVNGHCPHQTAHPFSILVLYSTMSTNSVREIEVPDQTVRMCSLIWTYRMLKRIRPFRAAGRDSVSLPLLPQEYLPKRTKARITLHARNSLDFVKTFLGSCIIWNATFNE